MALLVIEKTRKNNGLKSNIGGTILEQGQHQNVCNAETLNENVNLCESAIQLCHESMYSGCEKRIGAKSGQWLVVGLV